MTKVLVRQIVPFLATVAVTAACGHNLEGPAPQVTALSPALVCTEQVTRVVTLTGNGLSPLAIDALTDDPKLKLPRIELQRTSDLEGNPTTDPPVVLPDDPANPTASRVRWLSQTSMSFEIFPELGLAPGVYRIRVSNANGNEFEAEQALGAIPPPVLESIEPDLICTAEMARRLTLSGKHFLDANGTLPTVTIGDKQYTVDELSGCEDAPGPEPGARICTLATVTVPANDLPVGTHAVVLTNPQPANCASTEPVTVAVVPPPTVAAIEPDLVCTAEGASVLTVTGTGFVKIGTTLPIVYFGSTGFAATGASGCTSIDGTLSGAESCTELTVAIPQDGLAPDTYDVVVTNPAPAGCSSSNAITIAVVPPPIIDHLAPNPICNEQGATMLDVIGTGFLRMGDTTADWPIVKIDGSSADVTVLDVRDCVAVAGTLTGAQSCTTITISVALNTVVLGNTYRVTVTNPGPASCSTEAPATLTAAPPPVVQTITPGSVCQGGGDVVVTGLYFSDTPTLQIGGVVATVNGVVQGATESDPDTIYATLGPGLSLGTYDVVVDNGNGCAGTLPGGFTVVAGPSVYFIDPPTVYNGISIRATIYVSGLAAAPTAVRIRNDADPTNVLERDLLNPQWSGNKILATVEAGTPEGKWDVLVSDGACTAILPDGLTITNNVTTGLTMDPPFGWNNEETEVSILADSAASSFQATPRVYLNPNPAGSTSLAIAVKAVAYVNDMRLTGIVPDGLAPGGLPVDYDLIVVNPDGTVRFERRAFTVMPSNQPPPTIDSITPASVINQPGQKLIILGENFRDPSSLAANVLVDASCIANDGTPVSLSSSNFVVDTATSDASTIYVTADLSSVQGMGGEPGGVCVVRVTNNDGTYAEYSAVAVTGPAANLPALKIAASRLNVPRRALAAAAGRVTSQSRFLYAIGGDDGTDSGTIASVEMAPVDKFGGLGGWSILPTSDLPGIAQGPLPTGRSFMSAAVIGRFIYLAGGREGMLATSSVLRAQILDPRDAPEVYDLVMEFEPQDGLPPGAGLAPGLYYYLVSAIMDDADASNPGGETLPGDPLSVIVPPLGDNAAFLTIKWTPIAGAKRYRIYRAGPDALLADAVLLHETADASSAQFKDDGTLTPGTRAPLPVGALGAWHKVGNLSVPREGAAVAFGAPPDASSPTGYSLTRFYLYAIGGRDDGNGGTVAKTALRSYDYAPIDLAADGSQMVGAFTGVANWMALGRWQMGAVAMDFAHASKVARGDTWIFALDGFDANISSIVTDVTAAKIGANGLLVLADGMTAGAYEVDDVAGSGQSGGYAYAGANDWIYVFGGSGPGIDPSSNSASAQLCGATEGGPCVGGAPNPPDLKQWNSLSAILQQPRYLPGSAIESAFVFLVGGLSENAAGGLVVTNTVEQTHW